MINFFATLLSKLDDVPVKNAFFDLADLDRPPLYKLSCSEPLFGKEKRHGTSFVGVSGEAGGALVSCLRLGDN